jgi:hypothetical protein
MQLTQAAPISAVRLWTGRIISALMVLFLIFDGVTKLIKVPQVLDAQARLGYPANDALGIGITVLACTLVYVNPRTSILGAILLTGYLGGAVASQVRIGAPLFDTSFPIIFGVLIWAGLYLRDQRLRAIVFPEPK